MVLYEQQAQRLQQVKQLLVQESQLLVQNQFLKENKLKNLLKVTMISFLKCSMQNIYRLVKIVK